MELRIIHCDVKGCQEKLTEEGPGTGFPGWGHVQGLVDPETKSTVAQLCPFHLAEVAKILNGGK